jgi:anti-sigma-K factor RskA
MTEHLTNEERRALLAGGRAVPLEPEEAAELGILADLLADPATWSEPGAGLEAKVLRAIERAEPRLVPAQPPVRSSQRRARTRRHRPIMLSALAAAAAVALVVGILAIRNDASPDYRARLTATALAPGARASADITHNQAGFRIALDARGLQRLHEGAYYQAWLKNGKGTLVAIGTFSSSDGGITLWSGVSPKEYRGISVTIEPDDNNPGSSGRRVLVGDIHAT